MSSFQQHSHDPLFTAKTFVSKQCMLCGCLHVCTSARHLFNFILRIEPQPFYAEQMERFKQFRVCRRAPVDALLGCRALAVATADVNEKSKPILT